ncbi:hypothetical protein GCM10028793_31370 [Nocardiopsis oceani]
MHPPADRHYPPEYGPQDVKPALAWYWAGFLCTPATLALTLALFLFVPPLQHAAGVFAPMLTVFSLPVSAGVLIGVYATRSSRLSAQWARHVHQLRFATGHPGYPAPLPPRPRIPARDLRPRRLWYVCAVLCVPLAFPVAIGLAPLFDGFAADTTLPFAFPLGLLVASGAAFAIGLRRAAHRVRLVREHMAREWAQAHRDRPGSPGAPGVQTP